MTYPISDKSPLTRGKTMKIGPAIAIAGIWIGAAATAFSPTPTLCIWSFFMAFVATIIIVVAS